MRTIANTNILVDDFDFCKAFPPHTFVHFLTHFHADHYYGLSPRWAYSHIYTTPITQQLLALSFPHVQTLVRPCPYQTPIQIEIADGLRVTATFLNAWHIPGSAMILFEGYFGTVLFTGDFRFTTEMFKSSLFTKVPKLNASMIVEEECCARQVDQLIFDNTYCNEAFQFPPHQQIQRQMKQIILQHPGKKVYIAMGALGKDALLSQLGKYFKTLIIVSKGKLKQLEVCNSNTSLFTTDKDEGFIQLVRKKDAQRRFELESAKGEQFIWIETDFLMVEHQHPDKRRFMVPYSLHSNYQEMRTFISAVKPAILKKLVNPVYFKRAYRNTLNLEAREQFQRYLSFMQKLLSSGKETSSGYKKLVLQFTNISRLSPSYLNSMQIKYHTLIREKLAIPAKNDQLRKRKINLSTEMPVVERKCKQSFKEIGEELRATHKNESLEQSWQRSKHAQNEAFCEDLFQSIFN